MRPGPLVFVLAVLGFTMADNPLVPDVGMADPHLRVLNGSYVLFATHDFSVNNTDFLMKDWWVWTTTNLVNWTKAAVVVPGGTPGDVFAWSSFEDRDECWATDGAYVNGTYYYYLTVGSAQVGVLTATSVNGPWTDPLKAPLLSVAMGNSVKPPTTFRDPGVFQDDDGSSYIISGVYNYFIARLNNDMISLAEPLRFVKVDPNGHPAWGPYGNATDDKPFLHKHNGRYYLSWGCFYGIADSPYGPFFFQGSVVMRDFIAPDFQLPYNPNKGWYGQEDLQDRHGSFCDSNGQSYFVANDRSHSGDVGHAFSFRDSIAAYIHYYDNGTIHPAQINAQGVGSYDIARSKHIEAENFGAVERAAKVDLFTLLNNGRVDVDAVERDGEWKNGWHFGVQVQSGSVLYYPNIRNIGSSLGSSASSAATGGATLVLGGMGADPKAKAAELTLTVLAVSGDANDANDAHVDLSRLQARSRTLCRCSLPTSMVSFAQLSCCEGAIPANSSGALSLTFVFGEAEVGSALLLDSFHFV